MKKFRFALETALNYRQSLEEREKELLARALRKVQAEERLVEVLNLEKREFLDSLDLYRKTLTSMLHQEAYMHRLDTRIHHQQQELDQARKASSQQRSLVAKAAAKRRILERLKEKNLEEYQGELLRAEQKLLDEVGITAFGRKDVNHKKNDGRR